MLSPSAAFPFTPPLLFANKAEFYVFRDLHTQVVIVNPIIYIEHRRGLSHVSSSFNCDHRSCSNAHTSNRLQLQILFPKKRI